MRQRKVTSIVALLVLSILVLSTFSSSAAASFDSYVDLPTHWARSYIEQMYNLGALDDSPPLYHPDTPITRGKFARYLVLGWGLEPYSGVPNSFPTCRRLTSTSSLSTPSTSGG